MQAPRWCPPFERQLLHDEDLHQRLPLGHRRLLHRPCICHWCPGKIIFNYWSLCFGKWQGLNNRQLPTLCVHKCGKIWQNFATWSKLWKSWQFIEGLFSIWGNFEPTLTIFCYWVNFQRCKCPKFKKWTIHLVTLVSIPLVIKFIGKTSLFSGQFNLN